jgi:hypothetical protein
MTFYIQLEPVFVSTMNIRGLIITSCLALLSFGDVIAQADQMSCFEWRDYGRSLKNQQKYQASYDTLKTFMEHCASESIAPSVFVTQTGNVVSLAEFDKSYWVDYREWLKKVLYYSSDSNYYCLDADAIIGTFQYFPGRGYDINGSLAVAKYLFESGKCSLYWDRYAKAWGPTREDQFKHWQDTVSNPESTPFDSTLPTLEDLGLGILRGPQGSVGRDERMKLEWLAVPNPFIE